MRASCGVCASAAKVPRGDESSGCLHPCNRSLKVNRNSVTGRFVKKYADRHAQGHETPAHPDADGARVREGAARLPGQPLLPAQAIRPV